MYFKYQFEHRIYYINLALVTHVEIPPYEQGETEGSVTFWFGSASTKAVIPLEQRNDLRAILDGMLVSVRPVGAAPTAMG